MELKCVLVLAFFPLVSASPHGYGVKGGIGAAAKAEAAGATGVFPGVPLAIPSGAGYSGSFAKSSSSSFASSSASSSASSFSFSGSGTAGAGTNELSGAAGNGVETEGCNENCKSGNNVISDMAGAGSNNQGYSGAKAAAGAGAVAISGAPYGKNGYQTPCLNGDCSNQKTSDCGNSKCGDNTHNNEKCTSGKCEPTPQTTDTKEKCTSGQCSTSSPKMVPTYDTDDIKVNIASAGPKTLQNSNDQLNNYFKKPSYNEPSLFPPSTPNKPTTYLTTPKEDTPCTSSGCAPISLPNGGVYDKEKPSSYNVPILGPNYASSTQNIEPCSNGNCNSAQTGSPPTNLPSGSSGSGSICASGSCQKYPNNQINPGSPGVPSGYKPLIPPVVPKVGPSSGAKNPNYAQPITPFNSAFVNTGAVASSNAIGNDGAAKPTIASTDKNLPMYTGGFGGPAGILKPNDFSAPNQIHVSSFKPVQSTAPIASAPCTSGNCVARPTKPESNVPTCSNGNCENPKFPVFTSGNPAMQIPSQPSACSSGSCGASPGSTPIQHRPPVSFKPPSSTGHFGGPPGILKPNDYSKPGPKPTPTQGSYNPPSFPSMQNNPTNEPNIDQYKPVGTPICSYGNCGGQVSSNVYNPSGPSKPITELPSVGFGGPEGILKPTDFNKPLPSYKPTPAAAETPICSYGNCGGQVSSSVYSPSGPSKPITEIPSVGFGGPEGILKPNDFNKPLPSYKPTPAAAAVTSICSDGNCGGQVSSSVYSPSEPSKPITEIPSGGFGGPEGIVKPNDFNKPLPSYKPTPAAAGNFNPPGPSSPQHNHLNKPKTPQYKPAGPNGSTPCSSGNCGYQPPQSHFGSSATAQTYPSLCGSGKCQPQPTQTSKVPAGVYNPAYCTSGNCGTNQLLPIPSKPTNPSSSDLNQPKITGSYHSTFQTSPSSSNYGPSQSPSQAHSSTGIAVSGSFNPSCSPGKCGHEQPSPHYGSSDSKPASSANTYSAQPCPAGKCGSSDQVPNIPSTSAGTFLSAPCSSGNCGVNSVPGHSMSHYNQPGSTNIAVGAVASAGAVAYTGGFGGPPGLLKPYDGGKLSSLPEGFGSKGPLGAAPYGPAVQSSYGKSLTGAGFSLSGAGAQAGAAAGAAAGSYGGNGRLRGQNEQGSGKGGCTSGCGSPGDANFGQIGGLDGFGALSAASASARSVAGTFSGSGAGAYGQAGSFASSSATAHASAGAAAKGAGYGRR